MKNNQTNQPDDNYIDSEKDLILVNKELESHEDFYKMALQFQQIMMVYESAIKQVEAKLEILNNEEDRFVRQIAVNNLNNPRELIKIALNDEDTEKVMNLIEALEDIDDVSDVYHNLDI